MMGKGLFIAGTDTGVGKTFVAGALATLLRARGIDVGVMKPAETGCPRRDGRLLPQDAIYLKERAASADPLDEICPYPLEMPAAPAVAADAAGIAIDLDRIAKGYRHLAVRHQLTLVEGAGGLLVPLTDTADYTHLIQKLHIPVLVVARASLGTINHTLLTWHWASHLKLPILGVVVNSPTGPPGPSEEANLKALAERLPTPLLGRVPYLPAAPSDLSLVEKLLDLDRLLELLEIA
ncbi:MAG: dethiobiotin synthase [Candidatus Methylomirabilales bacterium]